MEKNSVEEVAMKALLIVYSYHHNNTQKIAEGFAKVLDAQIVTPQQTNPQELQGYDLIGFGSGIDSGKHYKELLDFAESLPEVSGKNALIFSTSGVSNPTYKAKIHTRHLEKNYKPKGIVLLMSLIAMALTQTVF
jgi:flavodoxin